MEDEIDFISRISLGIEKVVCLQVHWLQFVHDARCELLFSLHEEPDFCKHDRVCLLHDFAPQFIRNKLKQVFGLFKLHLNILVVQEARYPSKQVTFEVLLF